MAHSSGRVRGLRLSAFLAFALIAAIVPIWPSAGLVRSSTFAPAADTYIRADRPTTNFGGKNRLYADSSPTYHTLIRFDVSGIAGHVDSATLRLYATASSPVGGVFSRVTDDTWGERTVTWNSAPPTEPTPVASLGATVANTWMEVDLSSVVTGNGVFSLRIASTSATAVSYVSREATSAALRPQLVVVTSTLDDTTPPRVAITSPTEGQTVSGSVNIAVDATDDTGVVSVDLSVDGVVIASDTSAPYTFIWDTRSATNGPHTLGATGRDAMLNVGDSLPVVVAVDNVVDTSSFVFAAAGDHAANSSTDASLAALDASDAQFYLGLGDIDYDAASPDGAWCQYVVSRLPTKGPAFPFELVSGNHEQQGATDGYILDFTACLPDRLGAVPGPGSVYGAEYFFDYPAESPLMRVITLVPGLTIENMTYSYAPGSPHRAWLIQAIDDARAAGIPWVTVGLHYHCLTTGARTGCTMGESLWNLLLDKHVDLVLNGHEHTYQRSKQLALDPTACPSMTANAAFVAGCIVDDGTDGIYPKGTGTVNVVAGTFGQRTAVNPDDSEAPYFGAFDASTNGFVRYAVTRDRIDATFVNALGSFTDSFSIVSGAAPNADVTPPTAPTSLTATPAGSSRVDLSWGASSDENGVARYAVYRDGNRIGTSTTTTFVDTGTSAGATYTYEARAYDVAGNPSNFSQGVVVTMATGGTVVTILPAADATIEELYPARNSGSATTVAVDASPFKHALIRFDVSGLGGASILTAKLRLYCTNSSDVGGSFYRTDASGWNEATVTWSSAPPVEGPAIGSLGKVISGQWYELDLTSIVTAEGSYAFRVTSTSGDGAAYVSREGSSPFQEQLVLTTQAP